MAFLYSPILPAAADLQSTPTPSTSGYIKTWNGTQWVYKPMFYWDGVQWVKKPVKVWDGTQWALWNGSVWSGAHINPNAPPTPTYWLTEIGGLYLSSLENIETDSSKNSYVLGYQYVSASPTPFFAKLDSAGLVSWQKNITTLPDSSTYRLAISSDAIYIMYRYGTATVVKYDLSGTKIWAKTLGPGFLGYGIECDSSNVYVSGTETDPNDIFRTFGTVIKINSSGSIVWTSAAQVTGGTMMSRIRKVTSSGSLIISGSYDDGVPYTYVAVLNSSGVWQTAKTASTDIFHLTADDSGNIFYIDLSNQLVKLNSSLAIQWQRTIDPVLALVGITCDPTGNVYVLCRDGSFTTGVVVKYNSSGALQWQRSFTASSITLADITTDSIGDVYVSGNQGLNFLSIKIPTDGSLTGGTYLSISYQVSTYTMTSSGNATLGAAGQTSATSGVTASPDNNVFDAATTYWWGTATIP